MKDLSPSLVRLKLEETVCTRNRQGVREVSQTANEVMTRWPSRLAPVVGLIHQLPVRSKGCGFVSRKMCFFAKIIVFLL